MSLTLSEARARAALLSDVSYELDFDLTRREDFGVRAVVRFRCHEQGAATFLELTSARDVVVDGVLAADYDGHRLPLRDLARDNEVVVEARLPYVTDGDGMHTFTDPADGETYVGAYVGMDLCQRIFPCFDQNDLKAPVTVTVTAPEGWTALANGRLAEQEGTRWRFATTEPIPLPMFTVCAGPWHSHTWEHAGIPFGWHARASLATQLDRDIEELRHVTESCFDRFQDMFGEPYAFGSYDQVFVPGLNWGALENPGCITYRDETLPVGVPTANERRRRATVIAHEMAHQWFGNLVTMTWWEDTWLQESFADYMGYRLADEAAGFGGNFVSFAVGGKARAYAADERRSTHPVAPLAEEVPDVDEASNNFDSISYAKGNSAIRQLVTWLGDDDFLAGLRTYFARHRFGNAVLDDFVAALDEATDRDVRAWVQAWLRTTGFDTIRVTGDDDGVVLSREGSRPHRFTVTAYDADLVATATEVVDLADAPLRLPLGPGVSAVVPNSRGETFARLRLDPRTWEALSRDLALVAEDDTRAIVWSTAIDLVRCGELTPDDFLGLVTRHLPRERNVGILDVVLTWASGELVTRHLDPAGAPAAIATVAAACETGLASEPDDTMAVALTRVLARTTPDALLLQRWLLDRETHTGQEVDSHVRWQAIHRLAALGAIGAEEIRDERAADGTIAGVLGAARALAALPTEEAKAAAWERMTGEPPLSNREFEATAAGLWDPEQPGLVHPYVSRYLTEGLALAVKRGPSFEDRLGRAFPAVAFTEPLVEELADALRGDVPTVLRRAWDDALDDLRRSRG
ncbi:aminopeptidase N [Nocardioides coralli]|uniref:aminopeptidase N n=1 Tax=Nocardioides coralli TaxID=2872154 RepID=UPI001CA45B3D|nr:aminopeptidase N [Nocardioides coralli]QZY29795.1 aminopeptidase N [Nocardioides coralli]